MTSLNIASTGCWPLATSAVAWVHDAVGALLVPFLEGSLVFRDHEDFARAAEVAALAVGGVAFPNDSREVVPAHTGNVA